MHRVTIPTCACGVRFTINTKSKTSNISPIGCSVCKNRTCEDCCVLCKDCENKYKMYQNCMLLQNKYFKN